MRIWSMDEDGTRRLLAVPVGLPWAVPRDAAQRAFDPESHALLVPRMVGIGWRLNLGTVAARLGMIRPDDSLPDLEEHVPEPLSRALRLAPWAGAAGVALLAVRLRGTGRLATHWSLDGRPTAHAPARPVVAAATVAALGGAAHSAVMPAVRRRSAAAPEVPRGLDVAASAQALGIQSLMALALLAAGREARRPGSRQALAVAAPLVAPLVTGGVIVATVRTALSALGRSLAAERTADPAPDTSLQ